MSFSADKDHSSNKGKRENHDQELNHASACLKKTIDDESLPWFHFFRLVIFAIIGLLSVINWMKQMIVMLRMLNMTVHSRYYVIEFLNSKKIWTLFFEMNFPATNGAHQAVLLSQGLSAKLVILLQGWKCNAVPQKINSRPKKYRAMTIRGSRFAVWSPFPNCFFIFFFGKMQNKGPPQSPLQPVDPSEPTVRKHPSAVGMVGRSDSLFK
jgi:hypothetical protein